MKPKEIQKYIELVENSHISELEVSRWGRKVRIRKYPGNNNYYKSGDQENIIVAQSPTTPMPVKAPEPPSPEEKLLEKPPEKDAEEFTEVCSPMVGTFYRAPSIDVQPYIEVGDTVSEGQVLCIIEAMKLMNEIEAEFPCRIVDILVENARPVEYNQLLFKVEKI